MEHHFSTVWHNMAKIIIIVPTTTAFGSRSLIVSGFKGLGFIDVAVVHETTDGQIRSEFQFNLLLDNVAIHYNPEKSSHMFFDKLKNMHGYIYFIPFYEQPPRIQFFPKLKNSSMVFFLEALKKIQNSDFTLYYLKNQLDNQRAFRDRKMVLTLNYGFNHYASEPRLQTYEQIGYCAMIRHPPKVSYMYIIFVQPFDGLTWMFFTVTVVGSVAIWKLFRGHGAVESPWMFVYGMFVYFIGQGVDFSRRNRLVLTILVQLIILMIFVLSNAYEGVITSFMIQPAHENRLKTLDDFLKSNITFLTHEDFAIRLKDDERFTAIKSRMNFSFLTITFDEFKASRMAMVRFCEVLEDERYDVLKSGERVADLFYMLPEKLFTYYIELDASFSNPFLQRFQYYMDLCFQAGLPQIWKVMADKNYLDVPLAIDSDILVLKDLEVIFYILMAGCGLSGAVLLAEILFYGFIQNLDIREILCRLWNRLKMLCKVKKRKNVNVRIVVHPTDAVPV